MSRGRWEDYDHSDQEMDVYEQCCDNCTNFNCPLKLPKTAEEHLADYGTLEDFDKDETEIRMAEVLKKREQDGILRDGEPIWCVYWEGRGKR